MGYFSLKTPILTLILINIHYFGPYLCKFETSLFWYILSISYYVSVHSLLVPSYFMRAFLFGWNVLAGRATYLGCTLVRVCIFGVCDYFWNVLAGRATYLGCTLVCALVFDSFLPIIRFKLPCFGLILATQWGIALRVPLAALAKGMGLARRSQEMVGWRQPFLGWGWVWSVCRPCEASGGRHFLPAAKNAWGVGKEK